jgi:hypothetical protein
MVAESIGAGGDSIGGAMAPGGKGRGWNAKDQARNARGQFAAAGVKVGADEVVYISSDDEVTKPRVKRTKGEASTPIQAKSKPKKEAPTTPPCTTTKDPNPSKKGKNKVRSAFPLLIVNVLQTEVYILIGLNSFTALEI